MINKPLVSIIIPVYNGALFMREAINSAITQTYKNIEIIVVNDGSPDDGKTAEIAISYGDKIRYFEKENGGCSSAINYGISKMQGEYFSWLSHDDVYLPEKIEKEIESLLASTYEDSLTVVSCQAALIDGRGTIIPHPQPKESAYYQGNILLQRLLRSPSMNGCGMLIPKRILDIVGDFDLNYKYILDWDYWNRICYNGFGILRIDDVLVQNRIHGGQVTVQQSLLHSKEVDLLVKKMYAEYLKHDKKAARIIYEYALINRISIKPKMRISAKDRTIITYKICKKKIAKMMKYVYWGIVRRK